MNAIYDPGMHEPLEIHPWDALKAREARDAILSITLDVAARGELWPAHPDDDGGDLGFNLPTSVYVGAAGVIASLAALGGNKTQLAGLATQAVHADQTLPNRGELDKGSYMLGSAGPALAAAIYASDTDSAARLMNDARAMVDNDGYELFAGSPGFMIAAKAMFELENNPEWAAIWLELFKPLFYAWKEVAPRTFLWDHNVYGRFYRKYLGAAHGFAGTARVLLAGLDFVSDEHAATIIQRIVETARMTAVRDADGRVNWPAIFDDPTRGLPVQWCHGAPGFICSLADVPRGLDPIFDDLLVAAGELVWHAGPLRKGASLCHGAAGNGFAFLRLYQRTGEELWLERARAFAMHAIAQADRQRKEFGVPWHSLWTGDLGIAVYADACISARPDIPSIDGWPVAS